tara:strand:- start:560 stop:895 length:336 start_codon:yes stop_codon:yes gene_type:complete
LSKIKNNKKPKRKIYDNHYSEELVKILTANSILSDVYLGKQHLQFSYTTTRRRNLDRSSDNYLVYCTNCKLVWENHYRYKGRFYYDNIPSYGKKRVTCERCEKDLLDEQNN